MSKTALGAFLLLAWGIAFTPAPGQARELAQCQWNAGQMYLQSGGTLLPVLTGVTEVGSALPATLGRSLALGGPDQIAAACCKLCRKGKACGNSCIKKSRSCTKPPGCACDAE